MSRNFERHPELYPDPFSGPGPEVERWRATCRVCRELYWTDDADEEGVCEDCLDEAADRRSRGVPDEATRRRRRDHLMRRGRWGGAR